MLLDNRVFEPYTMELNNPLTDEQWDILEDVDFDHTEHIWFHTKHGKEVHFYKNAIPIEWIEKQIKTVCDNIEAETFGKWLIKEWEKENGDSKA